MRGKPAKKRLVAKDLLYDASLVTRLINRVMVKGEKSVARRTVYEALGRVDGDHAKALAVLEEAVRNTSPEEEVRSRRVGGATYQVPSPLSHERSVTLGVRWLVQAARKRQGIPMAEKLFLEIRAAANGEGEAVGKRADVQRMAEANRAFAHFRW